MAYSGAHDATIASVVSGRVDAAALDITVWRKFVDENKVDTRAVNVFYTTPPYFNYNWSVHADMLLTGLYQHHEHELTGAAPIAQTEVQAESPAVMHCR